MMNRISWLSVVLVLTVAVSSARAAVFERDWKMPGDGLLTYDDVSRREWLDVPESRLSQFPGNLEASYEAALAETLPGGKFEAFTAGSLADVVALAQSAGIHTATLDYSTNLIPTEAIIELLGITFVSRNRTYTMGFLDELSTNPNFPNDRLVSIFQNDPESELAGLAISSFNANDLIGSSRAGVMLFRASVPEPSTIAMAFVVLAMLIGCSVRRLVRVVRTSICNRGSHMGYPIYARSHAKRDRRSHAGRAPRFERCEDRRLLDTKADIVFMVDESFSDALNSLLKKSRVSGLPIACGWRYIVAC